MIDASLRGVLDALETRDANLVAPVLICASLRVRTIADHDDFAEIETVLMPPLLHVQYGGGVMVGIGHGAIACDAP